MYCRREGKEQRVDKRRTEWGVGKRLRPVGGDTGQRVLFDTGKPPEDAPAARVKLGVVAVSVAANAAASVSAAALWRRRRDRRAERAPRWRGRECAETVSNE